MFDTPSPAEDEVDDMAFLAYIDANSRHYHDRSPCKKCVMKDWENILAEDGDFSESDFLLFFRVHQESFFELYNLIKDHPVFQRSMGPLGGIGRNQAPAQLQILVFLFVAGSSGSELNYYKKVAKRFDVSQGIVRVYVRRVQAAILSLEKSVVIWPNAEERREIATRFLRKYGFPNCVGVGDGTYLYLMSKPSKDGENYKTRKRRVGLVV